MCTFNNHRLLPSTLRSRTYRYAKSICEIGLISKYERHRRARAKLVRACVKHAKQKYGNRIKQADVSCACIYKLGWYDSFGLGKIALGAWRTERTRECRARVCFVLRIDVLLNVTVCKTSTTSWPFSALFREGLRFFLCFFYLVVFSFFLCHNPNTMVR